MALAEIHSNHFKPSNSEYQNILDYQNVINHFFDGALTSINRPVGAFLNVNANTAILSHSGMLNRN